MLAFIALIPSFIFLIRWKEDGCEKGWMDGKKEITRKNNILTWNKICVRSFFHSSSVIHSFIPSSLPSFCPYIFGSICHSGREKETFTISFKFSILYRQSKGKSNISCSCLYTCHQNYSLARLCLFVTHTAIRNRKQFLFQLLNPCD